MCISSLVTSFQILQKTRHRQWIGRLTLVFLNFSGELWENLSVPKSIPLHLAELEDRHLPAVRIVDTRLWKSRKNKYNLAYVRTCMRTCCTYARYITCIALTIVYCKWKSRGHLLSEAPAAWRREILHLVYFLLIVSRRWPLTRLGTSILGKRVSGLSSRLPLSKINKKMAIIRCLLFYQWLFETRNTGNALQRGIQVACVSEVHQPAGNINL